MIGAGATIGWKKEATWGTYITPDLYYRADSENFLPIYDTVEDNSIIGNLFNCDNWKTGERVECTLPGSFFPDQAGMTFLGVLGGEAAVSDPINAYILVSYNGTSLWARLTKSSDNLTAELSDNGTSWNPDTNFNTTGTIDVSDPSFDTLTELAAAINGYTGWNAVIFGASSTASTLLADFTATNVFANDINQGGMLMMAEQSLSTDCKLHTLSHAALTSNLPSFSFIVNRGLGTNKSLTFAGNNETALSITVSPAGALTVSLSIRGKVEAINQTDVSLTPSCIEAFIAARLKLVFEDEVGNLVEFDEAKGLTINFNPNLDENKVLGDMYIKQPTRQPYTIEISGTANNTTGQYALISQYKAFTKVGCYIYCDTSYYANSTNLTPYSFLIRIPQIIFSQFQSPTDNKDRYVITFASKVMKSNSSTITNETNVYVVDKLLTTY